MGSRSGRHGQTAAQASTAIFQQCFDPGLDVAIVMDEVKPGQRRLAAAINTKPTARWGSEAVELAPSVPYTDYARTGNIERSR